MAIFIYIIDISKKDKILDYCFIYILIFYFKKNNSHYKALIKASSRVNIITSIYTLKFDLKVSKSYIKTQNINKSFF